jgi:hypothetical protein
VFPHRLPASEIHPVGLAGTAVGPEYGSHSCVVEENRRGTGIEQRHLNPLAALADLETTFHALTSIGAGAVPGEGIPDLHALGAGQHE